jgi:hypothetical protein
VTFIVRDTSTFTTSASSAASVTTTKAFNGLLHAIHYTRDSTATAMSTTATVAITGETSGINYFTHTLVSTADISFYPRQNIHSTAGSTIAGFELMPIVNERLTFAIAAAGASKGGTFRVDVI